MAGGCHATERKEEFVQQWDETMGPNVEVIFPTRREDNMTEEEFVSLREKNVQKGINFGMRKPSTQIENTTNEPPESLENVADNAWIREEKGKAQMRLIALENRIRTMEQEASKECNEMDIKFRTAKEDIAKKEKHISMLKNKLKESPELSKESFDEL